MMTTMIKEIATIWEVMVGHWCPQGNVVPAEKGRIKLSLLLRIVRMMIIECDKFWLQSIVKWQWWWWCTYLTPLETPFSCVGTAIGAIT